MSYILSVKDPWFSASSLPPPSILAEISDSSYVGYQQADSYVSAMACIDQYQVCNPTTSPFTCTILGRFTEVIDGWSFLNLNEFQAAAIFFATQVMPTSSIFWVTSNLGMAPLLTQELVSDTISAGLPENQWQLEFQSWFKTGLARLQASILAYPVQPTDLDPGTEFKAAGSVSQAERDVCSNIRIKNTGGYQSFSALGLVIILAIGTPIIILSFRVEPCVAAVRRRRRLQDRRLLLDKEDSDGSTNNGGGNIEEENVNYRGRDDDREVARIADCVLQLQRKVLTSAAPKVKWEAKMQIFPVTTDPTVCFPLARRVVKAERESVMDGQGSDAEEDDYEYRREEDGVESQDVQPITDDQYQELPQPEREVEEAEAEDGGRRSA